MSRIGLAYYLVWYQRVRVVDVGEKIATINVAGLAKVQYGRDRMRWVIELPEFTATYYVKMKPFCIVGSKGRRYRMNEMFLYLTEPSRRMAELEYHEETKCVLGWKIEPKFVN